MKILLINSTREGEVKEFSAPDFITYDFACYPPLGLLAIAAEIDPRHEVKILDSASKNMLIREVVEFILDFKPDLLGISIVSRRLFPAKAILTEVKKIMPEIITVAGGPHINDFPIETMELGDLDYLIGGFAEKSFPQFIEAIDNQETIDKSRLAKVPGLYYKINDNIKFNPSDPVPVILDDLPFPKRDLVDLEDYFTAADRIKMTTLYTSRGCPYKCTFCDVQDKTYHYRSSASIVDEFEYIISLGIKEIHIFDDTFNLGRKRVISMCEEILRRGVKVRWSARVRAHPFDKEMLQFMEKAGCVRLQCGVESLDPLALRNMKKKITLDHIKKFFKLCNEFKIETFGYFIFGYPEETVKYRKNFFKEINRLNLSYAQFAVLYPLPQTQIYYDLLENGFYKEDHWANFFKNPTRDFSLPPCREPKLHQELLEMNDLAYKKFYLSPKFIINDLKRTESFGLLMLKAKLAIKMFFMKTKKQSSASPA